MLTTVHTYESKRLLSSEAQRGRVGLMLDQREGSQSWLSTAQGHFYALKVNWSSGQWELLPSLPVETTDRWVLTHSGALADLEAEGTYRVPLSPTHQSGSPHWTKPWRKPQ